LFWLWTPLQEPSPCKKALYLAEGGIDTATVDIPLPYEGAPEMVRDLHEANPSIPVLMMTALEDCAVHEQMLRAGADEVVEDAFTFAA
jgi:CheY-like chemotaxis protein